MSPVADAEPSLLDKVLNTVYQRIQQLPADRWDGQTTTLKGIRNTERKWIALADAWAAFGRVAYPHITEAQIRARLIHSRLDPLTTRLAWCGRT